MTACSPTQLRLFEAIPTKPALRLVTEAGPAEHAILVPPAVYRRRRLGVMLAAILSTAVVWRVLAGPLSVPDPTRTEEGARSSYVAREGDSYWSIARDLSREGDIRSVVDRLVELNAARPLEAGDLVVIPPG